jgi:hypothetical protein
MKLFARVFGAPIARRSIVRHCLDWLNCLIFRITAEVLEDMSLQVRNQKSPTKRPHRQMLLAMEKLPLSDQIPSEVRSKCVVLMAELFRIVIFRSQPLGGDRDER